MSIATDRTQQDAARLGAVVMVVVTGGGPMLPRFGDHADLPCEFAELLLLARLSEASVPGADQLVDEVAQLTGTTAEHLRSVLDALEQRGSLSATFDRSRPVELTQPAPALSAQAVEVAPDVLWVMPTPYVLGVADGDFVQLDHDGRTILRFGAVELDAATRFTKPVSTDEAFAAHQERTGALALDRPGFDALVASLVAQGVLRSVDLGDLTLGRGYNKVAEEMRRQAKGRSTVSQAMVRSMVAHDEIEAAHRARTGLARTKVFPIHSIPTDWRNPPLSLGLILAYAKEYEGGRLEEHFDFRPDWLIDEQRLEAYKAEPGIYLFSSYIWSSSANLALSARVKALNPDSITIHGGPNVPKYEDDVTRYFADNPDVDITVRGEGEITMAEVLSALAGQMGHGPVDLSILADVAGITYRHGDEIVRTADRDRLPDLDVLPSPYLTGLFDAYVEGWNELALVGAAGTDGWAYKLPVVVLETNRGCPYGCTFCDWGSATLSRVRKFDLDRVFGELEWVARHGFKIAIADANFGIFERDVEIAEQHLRAQGPLRVPQAVRGHQLRQEHGQAPVEDHRHLHPGRHPGSGQMSMQSYRRRDAATIRARTSRSRSTTASRSSSAAANLPMSWI